MSTACWQQLSCAAGQPYQQLVLCAAGQPYKQLVLCAAGQPYQQLVLCAAGQPYQQLVPCAAGQPYQVWGSTRVDDAAKHPAEVAMATACDDAFPDKSWRAGAHALYLLWMYQEASLDPCCTGTRSATATCRILRVSDMMFDVLAQRVMFCIVY
jgi:hypothetical protein